MIRLALQKLHLDQQILVVHLLQLTQQLRAKRQCVGIHARVKVERNKTRLKRLPQEGALLLLRPFDAVLAQLHFDARASLEIQKEIDETSHQLGSFRLRDEIEKGTRFCDEIGELLCFALALVELTELEDALLFDADLLLVVLVHFELVGDFVEKLFAILLTRHRCERLRTFDFCCSSHRGEVLKVS